MLLIKKIDADTYEISHNKKIVAMFYDNIVDVHYFFNNGGDIVNTDNLPELINKVKLYIKNMEVRNVG